MMSALREWWSCEMQIAHNEGGRTMAICCCLSAAPLLTLTFKALFILTLDILVQSCLTYNYSMQQFMGTKTHKPHFAQATLLCL